MQVSYNQVAGRSIERIAALSDGIFAVAMTLLVLDLHVPPVAEIASEQALLHALYMLLPQWLMFVMSCMTLGIFWTGQQTQLHHMEQSDRNLVWIHIFFLSMISLIPFSTRLLAEFMTFRTALIIYWLNILMAGLALYASWSYAVSANLVKQNIPAGLIVAVKKRISHSQMLYALGAALCYFSTYYSIAFIVLLQLNYAAPRFMKRRKEVFQP